MKLRTMFAALIALACAPLASEKAAAQNTTGKAVTSCGGESNTNGNAAPITIDLTGKECVSASVSASVTGFAPGGAFATLTATASSASVALPAGAVVLFQNTGTTAVSCTLGVGSATAVASENIVQPGSWIAFTVGANTFGACIDQAGSASNVVALSGGTGLPTGSGGGGSGGGGAITAASGAYASGSIASGAVASGAVAAGALAAGAGVDGWDLTQGAKADAAWVSGSGSVIALLKNVATGIASALPAGTNLIGYFGGDGTAGTASTHVVTVQGIASMTKLLVTPDSVALPANQSVNESQINGVTPLMGNGVTGTGSQRVTIASDNSAVSGLGAVATGAAPPANAVYLGANASGATGGHVAGLISCDNHFFKHITSATDTLGVQGVASQTIYICGWRSRAAGTATWYLENTASANANCSSTLTQITGVASEVANSGENTLAPFWTGLKNTSGNGLCINSTGTGGVDVDVWYTQF